MVIPLTPWQPPHPLDGPWTKIIRAGKYLQEFNDSIAKVRGLNPYRIVREEDTDRNRVEWRIVAQVGLGSLFNILAGEIIYHLHSGLNHLAWQLTALGGKPSRKTGFPMLGVCDPRVFEEMTKGMPRDAIRLINGLQPYQRGDAYKTDALWALNELRNQDAHRFLIEIYSQIRLSASATGITLIRKKAVNDGDVVAWGALDVYRQQNFEPQVTYHERMSVGALAGEGVENTLSRIYIYVRKVAYPVFERFFPERP